MDSINAFLKGEANRHKELMVFDWDKCAQIIKERGATSASAGLADDWEWTGGQILVDGEPMPKEQTYTYLASTWATPELRVDGDVIECYRMESQVPKWDAHTYWPDSALSIIGKTLRRAA